MKKTRKQLTLFLEEEESDSIETIRKRFNPTQHQIIRSHITLCREDEIEEMETILYNLEHLKASHFELELSELIRFSEGKGVLIKVIDSKSHFKNLRKLILKNIIAEPREHQSHITLMHPRNSICNDFIFEEIQKIELPKRLSIKRITLIEQEIGKKWNVLKEYKLENKSGKANFRV
jgi:hypothetical protein